MPAMRGSQRDSDRAITLEVEVAHVPAHLALPGSPQAKHHRHAQLTGAELPQAKMSCTCVHRVNQSCPTLCDPVDCGLPGFPLGGGGGRGSPTKTLERTGQRWLPHPSRALYLLLPQPPAPLRTWCCQKP